MEQVSGIKSVWQFFYGSATQTAAEVYARWHGSIDPAATAGTSLRLKGPYSATARTLPTSFSFRQQSDRLWHTTIVDPCCWSPESPSVYRLTGGGQADQYMQLFGVRRFGVRDNHLWFNGRRWVFRAATVRDADVVTDPLARNYRENSIGAVALGEEYWCALEPWSLEGVPMAVHLAQPNQLEQEKKANLHFLAAHQAATMMYVLPAEKEASARVAEWSEIYAPNQILAAVLPDEACTVPSWCHVVVSPPDRSILRRAVATGRPVIAWDREMAGVNNDPTAARRTCEQLQRRLAPEFDLAGYWITQ